MFYILERVFNYFINILEGLIFIDAISTWILPPRSNYVLRTIGLIVDPILESCRRLQQRFIKNNLPVDLSPLIAILLLGLLRNILVVIF